MPRARPARPRRLEVPGKEERFVPPKLGNGRELLTAIRDHGGNIIHTEAALETSLAVTEADGTLSEIAGGRHLKVKIRNGASFYSLPGRINPELENRE